MVEWDDREGSGTGPRLRTVAILVLEISPADATVSIDRAVQTIMPPRDAIMLSAGQHELTVSK